QISLLQPSKSGARSGLTAEVSSQRENRAAHENKDTGQLLPVPNDPRFSRRLLLPLQLWPVSSRALFALLSINSNSSEASSFLDIRASILWLRQPFQRFTEVSSQSKEAKMTCLSVGSLFLKTGVIPIGLIT